MKKKKKKQVTESGAEFLRRTGKTSIWAPFTLEEKNAIQQAARLDGTKSMSAFVVHASVEAAAKVLKNAKN